MKALLEALEFSPGKKSRPGGWRVKATLQVEFDENSGSPVQTEQAEAFMRKYVGERPKPGQGFSIKILK